VTATAAEWADYDLDKDVDVTILPVRTFQGLPKGLRGIDAEGRSFFNTCCYLEPFTQHFGLVGCKIVLHGSTGRPVPDRPSFLCGDELDDGANARLAAVSLLHLMGPGVSDRPASLHLHKCMATHDGH
jgi:hypothetical protein